MQEFAYERAPDFVPHAAQALAEFAQALAGPNQWRLRIAARVGLEPAQNVDEAGIRCAAVCARRPDDARDRCRTLPLHAVRSMRDRSCHAQRKSHDLRHHSDAAPSRSLRLGRRKTPEGAQRLWL